MLTNRKTFRNNLFAAILALVASACGQDTFYLVGPFYDVPDPLPAGEHGDLIKTESVENDQNVGAWRLIFHSQDFNGNDIQSSAILFLPRGQAPTGGWPVLSVAHGTSGLPRSCAPSPLPFTKLAWLSERSIWDQIDEYVYPSKATDAGYAVIMADYQGTGVDGPYSYLMGELTGKNVLDATLAAYNLLGDQLSRRTFLWGHSQGGEAAGWASQQASTYAPDLAVLGTVLLAPAAQLSHLINAVLEELYNINQAAAAALLMTAVPAYAINYGLDSNDILSEIGKTTQEGVKSVCLGTNIAVFGVEALLKQYIASSYLDLPGGNIPPDWATAIGAQDLGQDGARLDGPTLVVNGLEDVIIPPEITCAYVEDTACPAGDTIQFNTYAKTGHSGVPDAAYGDIMQWMQDRMDSKPAPSNCSTPPAICSQAVLP